MPPPARRRRVPRWAFGCLAAALLFCIVAAVGIALLIRAGTSQIQAATDTVGNYYEAVEAKDYTRAHSYLSSPVRSTIDPSTLQLYWDARAVDFGAPDRFDVDNTDVSAETGRGAVATITGTLHSNTGKSEAKTHVLVKEGDSWKLSVAP